MYHLEERYWWYRGLRDRVVALLDAYAPQARKFLDAGCGTGAVLQELRRRRPGARFVGLDLSGLALAYCRTRSISALVRATVNELPIRSGAFDVVTSQDVLYFEGVDDDRALAELGRVLAAGGILLLNLPAFEWLRGAHDEFVKGRRRYSRPEVERLLRRAGLQPLFTSYWNAALFPAVALVRRLRRTRAGASESDLRPLPKGVNELLYALLLLESAWLRHAALPFGTSVIAVARKPAGR